MTKRGVKQALSYGPGKGDGKYANMGQREILKARKEGMTYVEFLKKYLPTEYEKQKEIQARREGK